MGDPSTNSVVKSSASDRPSTFTIQLDSSSKTGGLNTSEYQKEYGIVPGERAGILLTEKEAYTIRDNIAGDGAVPEGKSTGETLATIMTDNRDSNAGVDDLRAGYNQNPNSSVDATKPAPGTPYDPETQAARDGKVVDLP